MRSTPMAGLAAAALLAVAGCGGSVDGGTVAASSNEDSAVCDGDIPADSAIDVWYHQGEEADSIVVKDQVKAFNESQDDVTVTLKQIPVTDYANTIAGAAAADDLPAVLDTDASYAFNYAWSGDLVPLDDCIPDELREDLLPSAISGGTYAGKLWAIPMVDSGVGMWANKSALEGAGIRIPASADEAWTAEEFDEVLAKLKAAGFERPLDMKKNYGKSEWYAYGFAPILWSGGGDLIDRETYEKADGVINSPESVKAMEHFKSYFADGLVDDNTDDAAFVEGRSALSWVGYWMHKPYKEALGDDLVLVPLPDYGTGSRTSQGGWQWTITKAAGDPDAAWKWIEYTLQPENMTPYAAANSAPASRTSVLEADPLYREGGDLHLLVSQLGDGSSVARPPHPSYATVSSAYREAVQEIIDGADVQGALDKAAKTIDDDLEDNEFYPAPE